MAENKRHEHSWIFDGRSCCYRLVCSIPGCKKQTIAYYMEGDKPKIGEPVRILADGKTIERIGSLVG